jgi:hypothetical protein
MRNHAEASAQILEYFEELRHLAPVVRAHHEKVDGSGYPRGLFGDQIPLASRIIAVADIFEALTGRRPYRLPFPQGKALEILRSMSVDQSVVDVLADELNGPPASTPGAGLGHILKHWFVPSTGASAFSRPSNIGSLTAGPPVRTSWPPISASHLSRS